MALKVDDKTVASSPTRKKQKQDVVSSQKPTTDEIVSGNAVSGGSANGVTVPIMVAEERPKRLQDIVGNRIGPLNLQLIGHRTRDVIHSFFDLARDAEEHKYQELKAAIKIQSAWRSKAVRIRLKRWNAHATRIQSCYRGHLHREYASEVRRRVDKFLRLIYFGKHAVTIQRHFRGFYSRKYKHDFYQRKAYVERIVDVGEAFKQELRKYYLAQMEREQEEANKRVKGEIDNFIESSHCRVGTESKKGAFYSPLIAIFGKGRSYLEEHIKDARRRQVTGMELWRKAGFDEYGISIKVANNKFFVKQSKMPHSKLSMDTRRRVEDAAMVTSMLGTYIMSQNCGPYITKWQLLKKADGQKDLYNPHKEEFQTCPRVRVDYQHLEHPTVRQGSEWGQRERLRKEEIKRLEAEFTNMVENPFITYHPSGKLFDLPTVVHGKIFPKRHHHTHFPHSYADRDRRLNSMPTIDRRIDHGCYNLDHDDRPEVIDHHREKVRFQNLLTKKRLSSMNINRRHSRRDSHVT